MILHICTKPDWDTALLVGQYAGDILAEEGFIHCSTKAQVVEVANFIFRHQKDLVLLVIDENKVQPEIRYEDPGNGKLYPHIYGALNVDAVERVLVFPPGKDGWFELPSLG